MSKLGELGQPSEFWDYFEQITKIPRCSEQVRTYIKEEAERFGFETQVDNIGNLVVRIPAVGTQTKKVVLQCHLDMVCEKNEEIPHDFSRDPLNLKIVEIDNEKWVTAEGTTLGADNGVGICYLLLMMRKIYEKELGFDSLGFEFLFTVDEEQGLRGAFKIDNNLISGDYLINLDAEDEDSVTIGCAGGRVTFFHIKNETHEINRKNTLIPVKLIVSGLLGGHSGADIHLGRGNALKIIGQILWKLNKEFLIYLHSISGGNRTNAIPREANAIFYVEKDSFSDLSEYIKDLIIESKVIFEDIDPILSISITKLVNFNNKEVIMKKIQDELLNILYTIPNGPLSMHPKIKGLVFTSSNLGVIKTEKEKIEIKLSQRSLSEYFKIVIWEKAMALFSLAD
ncbi:MAG: beta-Ala-His dipeptidase [Candidatus Thorarchaeota archaeon]